MIFFLEVLFWVALVNVWRYRGKVTETNITNPDKEELIKMYQARRDTWSIVMWGSFIIQLILIALI